MSKQSAPEQQSPEPQSPEQRLKRAQGCLVGQLAGDALGSLVEFRSSADIRAEYPNGVRELKNGGTWNTIAGQPTDDSEMALALARSILRIGSYDPGEAADAYQNWLQSKPFDVGNTIGSALRGHKNQGSQANGALMRVSPLGIFAAQFSRGDAAEWAGADAALTHPNPVCVQANELYTMAIAEAVATGPDPQALWQQIATWAEERAVEPSIGAVVQASRSSKPADYLHQAGWVLIAFQNALYQLLHASSLEEAVVDTVMQGGDTDTNAAICGALLGAVYGIDAIPNQWTSALRNCRPEAGRSGVHHPRPPEYWPVDALEIAARLLGRESEGSDIDPSIIGQAGIERLVAFLPALSPGDNADTQFGEPPDVRFTGPKFFEILPSALSDVVLRFYGACYEEGFVQGFDWITWANAEPVELQPNAPLDDIDLRTVIMLLTVYIRADRFSDGYLLNALQNGTIARILQRLSQLGEQLRTER